MANENKWEYDYSNIYHKPAAPSSYTNVGSSGTNAANEQGEAGYFTQSTTVPPVQAQPTPVQPTEQAYVPVQPMADAYVPAQPTADAYASARPSTAAYAPVQPGVPTGAVNGMPPPPPSYAASAAAPKRTAHAKRKKPSKACRFLGAVAMLALASVVGFVGGYYGSLYGTLNGDTTVIVQQVTRDTSDATAISTSTDGDDLTLVSAAALASESVVVITTEQMVATSGWYGTQSVESGAGSGVIISEDGYILTCAHVVSGATNIIVTVGEVDYVASVIGSDDETDIAVIKIEETGLSAAVLGDSDALAVGEKILAVGNPLGVLGGSVTEGIVSALNRVIVVEDYEMTLVQMDASVSPGNSGGGLFNMAGELVGIVNAKSSDSDSEGIGFAIPINTAFALATSLIENGYITGRPELGVVALSISDAETAAAYGVNALGIYVYSINEGSAAQAAGLQVGDRLISIQDVEISTLTDLTDVIDSMQVGDQVTILIARSGQMMTVNVTLGEEGAPTTTSTSATETVQPETETVQPETEGTVPEGSTEGGMSERSTTPDAGTTVPDSGTSGSNGSSAFPFG
ncbi:MAG: trypsin-like peptidase domain-containing protein [Faecalibacterium sp.]